MISESAVILLFLLAASMFYTLHMGVKNMNQDIEIKRLKLENQKLTRENEELNNQLKRKRKWWIERKDDEKWVRLNGLMKVLILMKYLWI